MGQEPLRSMLSFAASVTREAGQYILNLMKTEEIQVQYKTSPSDLVTQVDRAVERFLIERIKQNYPDHGFLGEEGTVAPEQSAPIRWVIDPIDGTTNFVHQRMNFCVSVGVYQGDEGLIGVIYDPVRDEMVYAAKGMGAYFNESPIQMPPSRQLNESLVGSNMLWVRKTQKWGLEKFVQAVARQCRGIRSIGSAALEMAYVAMGRLDAYMSLSLSPWDFAAGKLIVEEAGGVVSDLHGKSITLTGERYGILFAHPQVHREILELFQQMKS